MDGDLEKVERELQERKLGREGFKERVKELISNAQESRMKGLFEQWMSEREWERGREGRFPLLIFFGEPQIDLLVYKNI